MGILNVFNGILCYMLWPQKSILSVIQVGPRLLGVCRNNRGTTVPVGCWWAQSLGEPQKSLRSVTLAGTQGLPYCALPGPAPPAPSVLSSYFSCSCTCSSSLLPFFYSSWPPSSLLLGLVFSVLPAQERCLQTLMCCKHRIMQFLARASFPPSPALECPCTPCMLPESIFLKLLCIHSPHGTS